LAFWDVLDGTLAAELDLTLAHFQQAGVIVFVPDGAKTLIGDTTRMLSLWDRTPPPNAGATAEQLRRWVSALGAADFQIREDATAQLIDSGPNAERVLATADPNDREVADRAAKIRLGWRKYAVPDHMVGTVLDMKKKWEGLTVHPDGKHWAAIIWENTNRPKVQQVVLGEVTAEGPREVRRLNDEHGPCSVAFSADGQTLYVGNADATISVWRVAP